MELFPDGSGVSLPRRLAEARGAARPADRCGMVRVAPGVHAWVPRDAAAPPDGYALCRWSRREDGTFAPVPVPGRWVRLNTESASTLGFGDGTERSRYDTVLRLGRAGFIETVQVSPGVWLLDLDSWFRHLADCMDAPDRWDEGSPDREEYLRANGLGGWKRQVSPGG